MFGLVEQLPQPTSIPFFTYNLHRVQSDGRIMTEVAPEPVYAVISPEIYFSPDGKTAVAQLNDGLYRIDVASGNKTLLGSKLNLYVVSPDLKYALISHATLDQPVKEMVLHDISGATAREVAKFNVDSLDVFRGFWLENDQFVLSFRDSVGSRYLSMFDTTGAQRGFIMDAEIPYQSSDYDRSTNTLYVRNGGKGLDAVELSSGIRTNLLSNYSAVDANGDLLAYIARNDGGRDAVFLRNLKTAAVVEAASDALKFVFLSPQGDKLAYVRQQRLFYDEIKVINVALP